MIPIPCADQFECLFVAKGTDFSLPSPGLRGLLFIEMAVEILTFARYFFFGVLIVAMVEGVRAR